MTAGGAILLGALLEFFGFSRFELSDSDKAKRYLIMTSRHRVDSSQIESQILTKFNDTSNDKGEYCQVVIGSSVIGEGIDLKSIRQTFVLTPHWNSSVTEQAIGRSIRSFSHDNLPYEERDIEVYRLTAFRKGTMEKIIKGEFGDDYINRWKSIDFNLYKTSEDKDIKIKQIERCLKETAVDCSLNRDRNILNPGLNAKELEPTCKGRREKGQPFAADLPFSKQCDYMEDCEYQCDGITTKYYTNYMDQYNKMIHVGMESDKIKSEGFWITDTYNLFYAYEEIKKIIDCIKNCFTIKQAYSFNELYERIKIVFPSVNNIVLSRALYSIITRNTEVKNRFGFNNFVRCDKNMFFLVDDPLCDSIYWNHNYAEFPMIEKVEKYKDWLNNKLDQSILSIIDQLEQLSIKIKELTNQEDKKKIKNAFKVFFDTLRNEDKVQLVETSYLYSIAKEKETFGRKNIPELYEEIGILLDVQKGNLFDDSQTNFYTHRYKTVDNSLKYLLKVELEQAIESNEIELLHFSSLWVNT